MRVRDENKEQLTRLKDKSDVLYLSTVSAKLWCLWGPR